MYWRYIFIRLQSPIMTTITVETTVGEIVRAQPARARVFENLHIDYCCGGKTPLLQACQAKGLDPVTVVAMLSALDEAPDHSAVNLDAMTLSDLCDHQLLVGATSIRLGIHNCTLGVNVELPSRRHGHVC